MALGEDALHFPPPSLACTDASHAATTQTGPNPAGAPRVFQSWFADRRLVPTALPVLRWVHAGLGWRRADAPPTAGEIALHLAVWTVACEMVGPRFLAGVTGDPWDALAYAVGGLLAWAWWNRSAWLRPAGNPPRKSCCDAAG